jgi:hypothetical protein
VQVKTIVGIAGVSLGLLLLTNSCSDPSRNIPAVPQFQRPEVYQPEPYRSPTRTEYVPYPVYVPAPQVRERSPITQPRATVKRSPQSSPSFSPQPVAAPAPRVSPQPSVTVKRSPSVIAPVPASSTKSTGSSVSATKLAPSQSYSPAPSSAARRSFGSAGSSQPSFSSKPSVSSGSRSSFGSGRK